MSKGVLPKLDACKPKLLLEQCVHCFKGPGFGMHLHVCVYIWPLTFDFGTVQVNDRNADTAASTVLSHQGALVVALFFFKSLLSMSFGFTGLVPRQPLLISALAGVRG